MKRTRRTNYDERQRNHAEKGSIDEQRAKTLIRRNAYKHNGEIRKYVGRTTNHQNKRVKGRKKTEQRYSKLDKFNSALRQ